MPRPNRAASLLASLMLVVATGPAVAHTSLVGSQPASGAILTAPPTRLELTFAEPTRVTSLKLVSSGGGEQRLAAPAKTALSVVTNLPPLGLGRHEVVWRALSADGHPVGGSVIFVVRGPAR